MTEVVTHPCDAGDTDDHAFHLSLAAPGEPQPLSGGANKRSANAGIGVIQSRPHHPSDELEVAQGVYEAGLHRRRIDQQRRSQLLYAALSLKGVRIQHPTLGVV
jgi:hypothetical protein